MAVKARDYIPIDIMLDILLRLPASTLARFRRVCKLWRAITRDPSFIDAHLDRARKAHPPSIVLSHPFEFDTKDARKTHHLRRYSFGFGSHPFDTKDRLGITVLSSDSLSPNRTLSRPKATTQDFRHVFLTGSCNGLLCICDGDGSVELLNPATGESLTLPQPSWFWYCSGSKPLLGFHPVTKEYKVIRFTITNQCEAYTLGTSSWRQICTVDFFLEYPGFTTAKGVMYWMVVEFVGSSYAVASFDLKDERFTKISPPNLEIYSEQGESISWPIYQLVELQDSVCCPVFTEDRGRVPPRMDIWMLNEEMRSGSIKHEWTRKYSILLPRQYPTRWPLLIHDQRILVYVYDYHASRDVTSPTCLLRYHHLNSKSGSREDVEGEDVYIDCENYFEPMVYVESLVALRNR